MRVYTRDDILAMTPEQLREAIAEKKGFTKIHAGYNDTLWGDKSPTDWHATEIPNWPTDISSAWELEESVPVPCRPKYTEILGEILGVNTFADLDWGLCHATAEQRSRVWLMWRDSSC